jgi:GTP-binding protein
VDGSGEDPLQAWEVVRGELDSYGAGLTEKRELIALTKADLLDAKKRAEVVTALEKLSRARVFPISAPLDEGMEPLLDAIIGRLGAAKEEEAVDADLEKRQWSPL